MERRCHDAATARAVLVKDEICVRHSQHLRTLVDLRTLAHLRTLLQFLMCVRVACGRLIALCG